MKPKQNDNEQYREPKDASAERTEAAGEAH
jgi:hypothetical protein